MTVMSKADNIRYLLRTSEWTVNALAKEANADPAQTLRLIVNEINKGNVVSVGYKDGSDSGWMKGKKIRLYTWAGDDDLITMSIRAAEYLREKSTDQIGKAIANHLMRLSGAST